MLGDFYVTASRYDWVERNSIAILGTRLSFHICYMLAFPSPLEYYKQDTDCYEPGKGRAYEISVIDLMFRDRDH